MRIVKKKNRNLKETKTGERNALGERGRIKLQKLSPKTMENPKYFSVLDLLRYRLEKMLQSYRLLFNFMPENK